MSDGLSKLLALNWQPADYIQLVTSIITFIAVVVSVVTFSKQINRQRKISAVDIGLKIEELVEKWAFIPKQNCNGFPRCFSMTSLIPITMVGLLLFLMFPQKVLKKQINVFLKSLKIIM